MADICGDNRFELIEKYKQRLLDATNIEDSPEEMAVIDNILFRFWQMGWLDRLELFGNSEQLESSHFADFGNMVGDIISRAAAIDVVHNYWKEESRKLPRKIVGEYEVMDGDYKSPLRHNKKICEAIEALPSAQQNCDGCKWSDAIGYGECHHCKRAYDDMYEKGVQP